MLWFPGDRGAHHAVEPKWRNTKVGQEAEREGNVGKSLYWGFHGKEPVKRTIKSRFGWFEEFQGLWDIGVCLALG